MSCKKMTICSLLLGAVIGFSVSNMNKSLDYKLSYLKRKLNCLNRKINKTLSSMSEENLKKYKDEIVNGYENIKKKIDSITIKDIKDAGSDLVDTLLDHIRALKDKLVTYTQ